MAAYAYKDVVYRADFQESLEEYVSLYGEIDESANYDGDYWCIAGFLLDKKDEEIARLQSELQTIKNE